MGIDDESGIERERSGLPTGQSIFIGALAGVTHGIVALALWEFFGFERPERTLSTEPLFVVYTLLGMFALGFVPGLLYATWRSVSPGLVIGGLLCLSSYGTWTTVRSGATPVDPTPFGWYALLWVGIAIPAAGAGGPNSGGARKRAYINILPRGRRSLRHARDLSRHGIGHADRRAVSDRSVDRGPRRRR